MTYLVTLTDRPGALERFLGICRRRRFPIAEAHLVAGQGVWKLTITFGEGCPPAERVLTLFARDHDVASIEPADAGTPGAVRRIA